MTVSAADYQWLKIIQAIGKEKGYHFTEDDVHNMDWDTKSFWL